MEEGRAFHSDSDPRFAEAVRRLHELKKDLVPTRKKHVCSASTCNPQSEPHLTTAPISNNIYLCKYGTLHICSEESCEHYGHSAVRTCYISGLQFGSIVSTYSKNDSRTWRKDNVINETVKTQVEEEKKKKPKKHKTLTEQDVMKQAETIVTNLLYSDCRRKLNAIAKARNQIEAEEAKEHYIAEQKKKRQLPKFQQIYSIMAHIKSRRLPLIDYEVDPSTIRYYSSIARQVWGISQRYMPHAKISFAKVCLGMLYKMRQGLKINGRDVLPHDTFLENNLPKLSDIETVFTYQRRNITKGRTHLQEMYNKAIKTCGAAVEDVMIKVTQLPDRNVESGIKKL